MNNNNNCFESVDFEIENGKVITYINGEKTPDFIPIRAKLILFLYLKNSNTRIQGLIMDHGFVERILELDSFVTRELMFEFEGHILEDEKFADFSEEIPEILDHLHGLGLIRSKMNENLIRQILYTSDVVVLNSVAR